MKRLLLALALCAPLFAVADEAAAPAKDVFVQGDAAAGAAKASTCVACHGPGGNGAINPEWPKLAGQHSGYVYAEIRDFQTQARKSPVMMGQAMGLMGKDQDMRDIAAYFAAQKPVPGVASKDAVAIAQQLYRAGDAGRGLPACAACHGPAGAGNGAAGFPRLGGQNASYSAGQLHAFAACGAAAFKDCTRGGDGKGQMMSAIAAKLQENEIQALASYVSGLQ
jgi:cytochrome c553